ncbi:MULTISPECIES: hypothetical protein [Rhizobium/Agrobacterium group]|nr:MULTISPECIES: hypothetical protein [unclassified Rhizobium]MDH7804830.1 hypothetical protein [Rhizobium sp. AN70]
MMQHPVGNHAFGEEAFFDDSRHQRDVLLWGELERQGNCALSETTPGTAR